MAHAAPNPQNAAAIARAFMRAKLPPELVERFAMLGIAFDVPDYAHFLQWMHDGKQEAMETMQKEEEEQEEHFLEFPDFPEYSQSFGNNPDHEKLRAQDRYQPAFYANIDAAVRNFSVLYSALERLNADAPGQTGLSEAQLITLIKRAGGVLGDMSLIAAGKLRERGLWEEAEFCEALRDAYTSNAAAHGLAWASECIEALTPRTAPVQDDRTISADPMTFAARRSRHFYTDNIRDEWHGGSGGPADSYYVLVFSPDINLSDLELREQICSARAEMENEGLRPASQAILLSRSRAGNLMITCSLAGGREYTAALAYDRREPPPRQARSM